MEGSKALNYCGYGQPDPVPPPPPNPMAAFLESQELSDILLQSKEGDKIPAHRVVLAAASDVFRTMFATEMREKADVEGVVKIADVGTIVLKQMLKFIYTGTIEIKKEELGDFENSEEYINYLFLELVGAGDKYHLPGLMREAGKKLCSRVTPWNAMHIYEELEKYEKEVWEAREDIYIFMRKNDDVDNYYYY